MVAFHQKINPLFRYYLDRKIKRFTQLPDLPLKIATDSLAVIRVYRSTGLTGSLLPPDDAQKTILALSFFI